MFIITYNNYTNKIFAIIYAYLIINSLYITLYIKDF